MHMTPPRVKISAPAGPLPLHRRAFTRLAADVLRSLTRKPAAVNVIVVDDRTIRRLNRRFLGHDFATDVITFPRAEWERGAGDGGRGMERAGNPEIFGEIYISLTTARREARARGIDPAEELLRYAVHGLLHLFGDDDSTSAARRQMWARQEALVRTMMNRQVAKRAKRQGKG